MKLRALLLSLLAPFAAHASIAYSNITTDTLGTLFYSTGPYTEIGDQILLAGTDRQATDAEIQFYNGGTSLGSFDATLQFYNVGAPVGTQIGSSFTVTGISIASGAVLNVDFPSLGNLTLPDNVIFTVSVANLTAGLDLGLDLFDPPTVGNSDNTFYIANNAGFATGSQGNGQDNLYFLLDATTTTSSVPEPSTWLLMLLSLPVAVLALKRRRAD